MSFKVGCLCIFLGDGCFLMKRRRYKHDVVHLNTVDDLVLPWKKKTYILWIEKI